MRRPLLALVFLAVAAAPAGAQEPARLPRVTVTAMPGPRTLTGVVRDTFNVAVEGVEITIPRLMRRATSSEDGRFRFDSIPRGKYSMRARKVGYTPQIREFVVGDDGGVAAFELLHLARALPAVVTSAARGGLSGVIADTGYNGVAGATVHLSAKSLLIDTDSSGAFFLPAPPGSHMVVISKPGYLDKVVSVTIPADSGRHMTVFLTSFAGKRPAREAWNERDMRSRLAWRDPLKDAFATREDMLKEGLVWAYELVRKRGHAPYDEDCSAVLNGGPATVALNALTVDEIEGIEVYRSARSTGDPRRVNGANRGPARGNGRVADSRVKPFSVVYANTERAAFENSAKFCPLVYIWTR